MDVVAAFGQEASGLNGEVTSYIDKIALLNLQSIATKRLQGGDVAGATKVLQNLATKALELGNKDLAATASQEADNLAQTGQMTSLGTKKLTFGTKKL
jgi:hypothetical protein